MNSTVLLDPGHKPSVFQSGCVCVQRGDCTRYGGTEQQTGRKHTKNALETELQAWEKHALGTTIFLKRT